VFLVLHQVVHKEPEKVAKSQKMSPDVDCLIVDDQDAPDARGPTQGRSVTTRDEKALHRIRNL
jgi:hypothetical protein